MTWLREFSSGLSGGMRLFIFLSTLAVVALLLTFYMTDDLIRTGLMGFTVLVVIFFGMSIALPPEVRRARVRSYSLYIALALSALILTGPALWPWVLESLFAFLQPYIGQITIPLATPSTLLIVLALLFVLATIFTVNYFNRDTSAMRAISEPIADAFPELKFLERLDLFCAELRNDLDRLDYETRWSHHTYISLDAEIDIIQGARRSRHVMDLLSAIKQQRESRLFIVLGDPGSGKSVALRKLARDLLTEATPTGRIPVYINLKDWHVEQVWSKQNPPSEDALRQFIFTTLRSRVANVSKTFVEQYADRLVEHGRWFFIFDSFDEIPSVLDSDEGSWLIGHLSAVLTKFLLSGTHSRGVIASRHYRQPDIHLGDRCILDIRPFSELKIAAAIEQIAVEPDVIKIGIFRERPDLGEVAKNPFLLNLILQYFARHSTLPQTRAAMFESYMDESINLVQRDLAECQLTRQMILDVARRIAWTMFSSDKYGLEMPIGLLEQRIGDARLPEVVDFLVNARIARLGQRARSFSFVHRRFNEYFLVDGFRRAPDQIPLEAIPQDSRWRDALVLYAEVAEFPDAVALARFCWASTQPLFSSQDDWMQYRSALHSFRFLVDAFRTRKEAISSFEPELAEEVVRIVASPDTIDLLATKHAVEAAGLVSAVYAEVILKHALVSQNDWISATAFRACRYLTVGERVASRRGG